MQSKNRYRGIDDYALICARYHARRLSEYHPCFDAADYEDIEQELILYFLTEAPKFDPAKSDWKLHVFIIIQRRARAIKLEAEAQKRGGRIRPFSIYDLLPLEQDFEVGITKVEATSSADGLWGDAYFAWNHLNLEARADVQRVIASLSPHHRQICEWLQERTPTEIARDTGIPRTTITSVVATLRKRLREAGLENYFQSTPSDSSPLPKSGNERPKK